MNTNENIFIVEDSVAKEKLGLSNTSKKKNMTDEVMQIFYAAQSAGKETLTLDEITAAYYNLFTKQDKTKKIKTKKEIALKLFNMKGKKDNNGLIELVPGSKGVYRLRNNQ